MTTKQYKTLTEKELESADVHHVSLGHRRIEWGKDNTFSLICDDEDSTRVYTRHSERVIGVLPLTHRKNQGCFVTIGLDHIIQISMHEGPQLKTLEGHQAKIIGVMELDNGQLISASEDNTLRFWELNSGKCVACINTAIDSFESVKFFKRTEKLALKEAIGVSIWDFKGNQVLVMKGQKQHLNSVIKLSSGNWLIWGENENPSQWSDDGTLMHRFNFQFDFESGFIELPNNELLIKSGMGRASEWNENSQTGQVSQWDSQGKKLNTHAQQQELTELFDSLAQAKIEVEDTFISHPDITYYPHARNLLGDKKSYLIPADEIEKQQLTFGIKSDRKKIWDFFNRPLFAPINTALKKQVKLARRAEKVLKDKSEATELLIEKYRKKRAVNKILAIIFLVLTVMLAAPSYYFLTQADGVQSLTGLLSQIAPELARLTPKELNISLGSAIGVIAFITLFFFMGNKSNKTKQLAQTENLNIQKVMLPAFYQLITDVKAYRRRLRREIPFLNDKTLFSGDETNAIIERKITESLQQRALDECGIEKDEVIYTNHEAIVLPAWSLIQDKDKRAQVKNKLVFENEFSFWGDKNKALVFAVQYVQYIFLTEEKIDVFTTYYDFISDKYVGKEANAFYYKDVTNISKREVDRDNTISSKDEGIAATEIALSVSSGETIRLTILNEDSMTAITEAARLNEGKSPEMMLKELEAKREQLITQDMDEDDREDELSVIDSEINSIKSNMVELDSVSSSNKADEAIKNIRKQIRNHKQDKNESVVSQL